MKFLSIILSFCFAFFIGETALSQIAPEHSTVISVGFGCLSSFLSAFSSASGVLLSSASVITLDRNAAARCTLQGLGVDPQNIQVGMIRTCIQMKPGTNSYILTINDVGAGAIVKTFETRLSSSDAFLVTSWAANFRQVEAGKTLESSYENQSPDKAYFDVPAVLDSARSIWSGKATLKVNQNPVITNYPLANFDIKGNFLSTMGKWRDTVSNILLTGSSTSNTIQFTTNGDTSGFPVPTNNSDEGVWLVFELSGILIPSGASTVDVTELMQTFSGAPTR